MKIAIKNRINGEIEVPADKSISHRALIITSLTKKETVIFPFFDSQDTRATLECITRLGVRAKRLKNNCLAVKGQGLYFSRKNKVILNAGESGTTMRIFSGLLCAQKFPVIFKAKPSLNRRPMRRITDPLRKMGADIGGKVKKNNEYPPLTIRPVKKLTGNKFYLPQASAQVKSALIFAGMYAHGSTLIKEPFQSRDHTERMLNMFGAKILRHQNRVICHPGQKLYSPGNIFIPGDFSSASFFIVLGLLCKNSELTLKKVNINHSRCGLLRVLERMGANIRIVNKVNDYEPYADIVVKTSSLRGVNIQKHEIPAMIDEIPILCVAASFARGKTIIFGVDELKVKETDRIKSMVFNLTRAGVNIWSGAFKGEAGNNIVIEGAAGYKKSSFFSFSDHRTAMSMIIFSLISGFESSIDSIKCVDKSFPNFMSILGSL